MAVTMDKFCALAFHIAIISTLDVKFLCLCHIKNYYLHLMINNSNNCH